MVEKKKQVGRIEEFVWHLEKIELQTSESATRWSQTA